MCLSSRKAWGGGGSEAQLSLYWTLSSARAGLLPGGLLGRRRASLELPSSPDPTQPWGLRVQSTQTSAGRRLPGWPSRVPVGDLGSGGPGHPEPPCDVRSAAGCARPQLRAGRHLKPRPALCCPPGTRAFSWWIRWHPWGGPPSTWTGRVSACPPLQPSVGSEGQKSSPPSRAPSTSSSHTRARSPQAPGHTPAPPRAGQSPY